MEEVLLQGMKKIITLFIIVVYLFIPSTTFAFDYLKFTAGVGSGYVIHELSHQAVADFTHTDLQWKDYFGNRWEISNNTAREKRAIIAGAGLASQIMSTEIILNSQIEKSNEYVLGILAFNIVNALMYPILDQNDTSKIGNGDVEMMDKAGLDRDYVTAFLVIHSLYSIYRVYHKTDVPVWLLVSKNEIKMGVIIYKW